MTSTEEEKGDSVETCENSSNDQEGNSDEIFATSSDETCETSTDDEKENPVETSETSTEEAENDKATFWKSAFSYLPFRYHVYPYIKILNNPA